MTAIRNAKQLMKQVRIVKQRLERICEFRDKRAVAKVLDKIGAVVVNKMDDMRLEAVLDEQLPRLT